MTTNRFNENFLPALTFSKASSKAFLCFSCSHWEKKNHQVSKEENPNQHSLWSWHHNNPSTSKISSIITSFQKQ